MKQGAKDANEARDEILSLLTDDEVVGVKAERQARLGDGDEYIDLAAPLNGVRRVHGVMQRTMGQVLPQSAVSSATWAKIVARFGARFASKTGR